MATVQGPLHSEEAHGSVGKKITYRKTKHGQTVVAYNYPGSCNAITPNAKQIAVRQQTKTLMEAWRDLPKEQQDTWTTLARERNLSANNVYLQENYRRLNARLTATATWPANDEQPAGIKIYSDAQTQPNLEDWAATFDADGTLTLLGNEVWATGDLTSLIITPSTALDGRLTFSDMPNLQHIEIESGTVSHAPTFANVPSLAEVVINNTELAESPDLSTVPSLQYLELSSDAMTTTPNVTGCQLLLTLILEGNAFTEIDTIINQIAANVAPSVDGTLQLDGGTAASRTATSAAAYTFLTTPPGFWHITTN